MVLFAEQKLRAMVPLLPPEASGFTSSSLRHFTYKGIPAVPSQDGKWSIGDSCTRLLAYRKALELGMLSVCKEGICGFRLAHSCSTWAHGAVSLVGAESFATVKECSSFNTGGSSRRPCGKTIVPLVLPSWLSLHSRLPMSQLSVTRERKAEKKVRRVESRTGPLTVEDYLVWGQESRSHRSLVQAGNGSKG